MNLLKENYFFDNKIRKEVKNCILFYFFNIEEIKRVENICVLKNVRGIY